MYGMKVATTRDVIEKLQAYEKRKWYWSYC